MDAADLARITATAERLRAELDPVEKVSLPDGVVLVSAATLMPEPIRWLWPQWLAQGKLHILAGAPGQGKTTIALGFVATVSTGGRWPDGTSCAPGNVLIWSGEDDPADTLLPRLLAMGADPMRIFFVTGTRVAGEALPFDPARDLVQLSAEAQRIGDVRLLMVDPVVSAVAGDSHKNGEVRRALQPLVDLAAAIDCAVVGISHFGKNTSGRDPTERVLGSVAFSAVARVVMAVAKVMNDGGDEKRILVRSKSNIGPDDGGFEYAIEQRELDAHPGFVASAVVWGNAVEGSARDLLGQAEATADDVEHDVEGFLRGLLASGPVPAKSVLTDCSDAGYSRDQVQRAACRLGVVRRKKGMSGGWVWCLAQPEGSTEGSEGSTHGKLRSSLPSARSSVNGDPPAPDEVDEGAL
jgi:putative DNA primase/helicase